MRYASFFCNQDNSYFKSFDISVICKIIEIGLYVAELTYKIELNGKQILQYFSFDKKIVDNINPNFTYTITAYDW